MTGRLIHYAVGSVLVRTADEGARVGLALLALQRVASATVGGVLVAVLLVPHVVAAPLVGLWADRASRPRLVVAAAAAGFGAALVTAAAGLGRLPLAVVLGVLLVGGCCGPALTGALSSQLSALAPSERLPRAFGLDSLTYNAAGIAGPALVAVLAAATSAALATTVLGLSALAGAAVIAVLPVAAGVPADRSDDGRHNLLAGARLVVRDRVLGAVTGATGLGQLGMGALPVIAALIAAKHQEAGAAGWLLTAVAAGGLIGSLAWTWRPARSDHAPGVVVVGLIGVGLPLAAAAFVSWLPLVTALFALAGFSNGPLFGALLVCRNDRSPGPLRNQIFTLGAGAKITSTAAGAALGGFIAGRVSVAVLLVLAGAGPLLGALFGRVLLRSTAAPGRAGRSGVMICG